MEGEKWRKRNVTFGLRLHIGCSHQGKGAGDMIHFEE